MALCIPSPIVEKIKGALISGELSIEALYDMESSAERRAELGKYVHEDLAKFINVKFEGAMVSEKKSAITDFLKEITTAAPKTTKANKTKTLLDKVAKLKDEDFLNPESEKATLTDLMSDRLGIKVTAEQMKVISEKADNLQTLKETLISKQVQSLPTKDYFKELTAANMAYYGEITALDKYLNEQNPTHLLKIATGGISRVSMLANLPPAILNQISNTVQGAMQSLERRIASGQYRGANADFAREYLKMQLEVFHKTGYDMSRDYPEDMRLGESIIHSEGPGVLRAYNRGMSKIVYKYLLGYADVGSASLARADSTMLQTTKIARKMGFKGEEGLAKALEIFKDSIQIEPQTNEGRIVREQAIADAQVATWTDDSIFAKFSKDMRDLLNSATGDVQLGYQLLPFIKTNANVLWHSIQSTGFGTIEAISKLLPAYRAMNDKITPNTKPMRNVIRTAVRSGLGMTLSYLLTALIPSDDFFTAYDVMSQKQRDELGLKKGVYNAVKIGGKWISLDFFGALGSGFVGMMYARKYGNGPIDKMYHYFCGVIGQVLQVPGIQDFADLYTSIRDAVTKDTAGKALKIATGSSINWIRSRVIPGIVNAMAKGTDVVERQVSSENLLDRTKAAIPGLRQTLPVKIEQTTGKEVQGEGFISNLLFGSRVKTANESALIDEITRLNKLGFGPTIAPIERSSERVKALREQIGDERFAEALKYFGREYGKRASQLIRTDRYKNATAEDKMKMLNKARDEVRDGKPADKWGNGGVVGVLDKFGYKKPVKSKGVKIK